MLKTPFREEGVSPGDSLRYEHAGKLPVYRFDQLNDDPKLVHAVFTRQGGVSLPPYASLNLGHTVGDDPTAVTTNHNRLYQALGVDRSQVVTCHLTHSADVLVVTAADTGQSVGKGDAMVTADSGVYLSMRFADCVPILLRDPVRRAIGLAHAGWRGTVKNVAQATVQTMVDKLDCSPYAITAVVGPSIGHCCYQVGDEVIQAVESAFSSQSSSGNGNNDAHLLSRRNERHAYFDLWEANRQQLAAAGVGRVVMAGLCTACHTDHFFSHRAERGRTGRFGVVLGYRG
jgi:YfiH family protein